MSEHAGEGEGSKETGQPEVFSYQRIQQTVGLLFNRAYLR
jgi:hypothetical protein